MARNILIILVIAIFTSCKSIVATPQNKDMDITKTKWLLDDDRQIYSWHTVIYPVILDFSDDKLSVNFSGYKYASHVDGQDIFIDGKPVLKIIQKNNNQLVLKKGDSLLKYIPVIKGQRDNESKMSFDETLNKSIWHYEDYYAKFENHSISLNQYDGTFFRGGLYTTNLFNNQIFLILNIDGSVEKKTYLVKEFNDNSIILAGNPNFSKQLILIAKK